MNDSIPESFEEKGYVRGEYLGKGSFGASFRLHPDLSHVSVLENNQPLMVKQVSLRQLSKTHLRQTFKEVDLLKSCRHPNIVGYADSFVDHDNTLNIVMEFCSQGDLTSRVGKVDSQSLWPLLIQMVQGLKYLHDRRILHRDIKPSNILLAGDGTVKIADMGLGRVLSPHTQFAQTFCGSPLYLAPEQHAEDCRYDGSCDLWALGCTLYELLGGAHPFESRSVAEMLRKIAAAVPPPLPPTVGPEAQFLVGRLLQKTPTDRPTCDHILLFAPVRRRVECALANRRHRQWAAQLTAEGALREQRCAELAAKLDKVQQRLQKYVAKARAHTEERQPAKAP